MRGPELLAAYARRIELRLRPRTVRPAACAALLRWAGLSEPQPIDHAARRERMLDRLADAIETHCDTEQLLAPLA